jgi:hypothetical protein
MRQIIPKTGQAVACRGSFHFASGNRQTEARIYFTRARNGQIFCRNFYKWGQQIFKTPRIFPEIRQNMSQK